MGIGHGAGDSRAEDAAKQAVVEPAARDLPSTARKGILFNITAGKASPCREVQKAAEIVRAAGTPAATSSRVSEDGHDAGRDQDHRHRHGLRCEELHGSQARHTAQGPREGAPRFGTDEMTDIKHPGVPSQPDVGATT